MVGRRSRDLLDGHSRDIQINVGVCDNCVEVFGRTKSTSSRTFGIQPNCC
jgi:hypothetical protein